MKRAAVVAIALASLTACGSTVPLSHQAALGASGGDSLGLDVHHCRKRMHTAPADCVAKPHCSYHHRMSEHACRAREHELMNACPCAFFEQA